MLSTSSNALWGHILPLHSRRDTSTTPLPPAHSSTSQMSMQPLQDRNATSLRVLLNSAEMSLQKFSSRVDELIIGVGVARAEMKHGGNLLDGVGDRVVGDVTSILNRVQGRVLEVVQEPAQQRTLESLAAEHKAVSTKVDLMQLQLETFTTQQATLQASINALQPLVLVAEKLSTRLESLESTTTNALAKLEDLVMEIATNLNDIKYSQSIRGGSSSTASKKRRSSISPHPSPEFPPSKRRKFDLAPVSPDFIPSSQPNSVGEVESIDGPTSSTAPTPRSSIALPLLRPTPFAPPTQTKYSLNNQISPVPVPCSLEEQKASSVQSHSLRFLENTYRMADSSQAASIAENPHASFPQEPRIPPCIEVEILKKTSHQPTSQIPDLSPRQYSLFAATKPPYTAEPISTTAALALQLSANPLYVQTSSKPKPTRRMIKLDSDGEEPQSGAVGQTCIDMLADL